MAILAKSTNTATDPVTGARSIVPQPLNFAADWRVLSEKPGEIVLTNLLSPVANPEKLRIAYTQVPDIFKGTGLEPAEEQSTSGVSVLIQLTDALGESSPTGNVFPVSIHLVMKVPGGDIETNSVLLSMLQRLTGALYDTGATSPTSRLRSLTRGALTPIDL